MILQSREDAIGSKSCFLFTLLIHLKFKLSLSLLILKNQCLHPPTPTSILGKGLVSSA